MISPGLNISKQLSTNEVRRVGFRGKDTKGREENAARSPG